ncbi:MAG: hypothetical protein SOW59_08270 [Corynebacterium sp.]|nr:hypothetical protein [Corynebacterium sp.]
MSENTVSVRELRANAVPLVNPLAKKLHLSGDHWGIAAGIIAVGTLIRIGVFALLAVANDEPVAGMFTAWDAQHYAAIAQWGYFDLPPGEGLGEDPVWEVRLAFFPALPMLLRLLTAVGINVFAAGFMLSTVASIFLAAGVMALTARWGYNLCGQTVAAIVATSAPMSLVLSMVYTEALFGALAIWALVALWDRNWLVAAALVTLLSTVRITAVGMVVVFAVMVAIYARRNWKAWLLVLVTPLPLVSYVVWASRHLTDDGSFGGYFATQKKHWNTGIDFGVATARWVAETVTEATEPGYLLSTLAIIAAPLALFAAWRQVDLATWLFCAAVAANILLSDGIMHSRPRLLLPLAILMVPPIVYAVRVLPPRIGWLALAGWVAFGAWFSAYMLVVFPWAI